MIDALGFGVQMMGRPHDQHDPSFERFRIDVVDLEGDLILSVRDTSPQVLIRTFRLVKIQQRAEAS
jgi:hypothetical protein